MKKKKISGFRLQKDDKWWFFGTVSKGEILLEMLDNRVGMAIDCIPSDGEITKAQYNKYVKLFCDNGKWKNPIGSATRLLALKRPDYFLCINGKNKAGLAKSLNISQNKITLDYYWEEIIMPIHDTSWYQAKPQSGLQQKIFQNRVALLDSIYYD